MGSNTRKSNFKLTVCLSNGQAPEAGANSFKEAYEIGNTMAAHYGAHLVKVELFPQTVRARTQCQKDFVILDCDGNADHYSIGEPVPMYCF